jgi:tetratricopeptide (TPR) repeat protein
MTAAMVRSLRLVLTLVLLIGGLSATALAAQASDDPDRLYAEREDVAKALAAASIWDRRLAANAGDFESAWKLARACYWLGSHVATDQRRSQLDRGIEAARRAIAAEPKQAAGHFWLAATMGAMAEIAGMRAGLRYRGEIKRELEQVLALDAAYEKGSADRALGRWYFKVPGLFGGDDQKSLEHLKRSLTYDPDSAASWSFMADTLRELGKRDEAKQALQKVLSAPVTDSEWAPETREFQRQAAAALQKLR